VHRVATYPDPILEAAVIWPHLGVLSLAADTMDASSAQSFFCMEQQKGSAHSA
jgi:hypothetical protein